MTNQEAYAAWRDAPHNGGVSLEDAFLAGIAYLRSQGKPVAWMFSKGPVVQLDVCPHGGKWKPLYLAPVAKPKWLDIETAPKDTALLLYCGWMYSIGHFNTMLGEWVECFDHRTITPTHWMPLPAAPEYKEE